MLQLAETRCRQAARFPSDLTGLRLHDHAFDQVIDGAVKCLRRVAGFFDAPTTAGIAGDGRAASLRIPGELSDVWPAPRADPSGRELRETRDRFAARSSPDLPSRPWRLCAEGVDLHSIFATARGNDRGSTLFPPTVAITGMYFDFLPLVPLRRLTAAICFRNALTISSGTWMWRIIQIL